MARAQWLLTLQARAMRFLMSIGLYIHKLWPPRPPSPTFTRTVSSTLSHVPGTFTISVYTSPGYSSKAERVRYPCLINFHGGGFTIGTSTDDARFVRTAIQHLDCVVLSIDYRLAPEHPSPIAVDDCADAVLWAAEHAEDLGIDPHRIALTGFSAGANLVLTVPVRLHDHREGRRRELYIPTEAGTEATSSSRDSTRTRSSQRHQRILGTPESVKLSSPAYTIVALAPFYPPTDYSLSRAQRRVTNPNPSKNLSRSLYALFDESYLPSDAGIDLENAYISPGRMDAEEMLAVYGGGAAAGKQEMAFVGVGCEWDMLCNEGGKFARMLREARSGQGDLRDAGRANEEEGVSWLVVKGAPHGWDKMPFLSAAAREGIEREYEGVCEQLKRVFDRPGGSS